MSSSHFFSLTRPGCILLLVTSLALAGCASVAPTHSGFISGYNDLQQVKGATHDEARRLTPTGQYRQVVLAPVLLRFDPKQAGLTPEQAEIVRATAQAEFSRALGARFTIVSSAGAAPAFEFRAAITRVDTSNAVLNAVSTVALFVPVNNGGVCVEWQAIDSVTRAVLAEGVSVSTGKPWQVVAAFQKTGHARTGLKKMADDVANYLRPSDCLRTASASSK